MENSVTKSVTDGQHVFSLIFFIKVLG